MIIAHLSDSHISLPEPNGSHRLQDLEQVVAAINALEHTPDVAVHTGDIAHDGLLEEYQAAHELLKQLKMPLLVLPGNKDLRPAMREVFHQELADGAKSEFFQYSANFGSHIFIVIDTLDVGERLGTICETRFAQLAQLLQQDQQTPTLLFMHHPPFEVIQAPRPFQFDSRETITKFETLIRSNPQIKEIICGHSHRYGDQLFAGIRARSIPSLAIDLRFGEYPESKKDTAIFEVYEF